MLSLTQVSSSFSETLSSPQHLNAGGLRIDPSSPDLWACLGACASTDDLREYALGRALALDPKRAPCWAALGRLYAEAGHTALSDRCLTAARSHDPFSAAAWEAMGTLASFSAEGMGQHSRCHTCTQEILLESPGLDRHGKAAWSRHRLTKTPRACRC